MRYELSLWGNPSWETNRSFASQQFLTFYDNWRVITTFTRPCYFSVSCAKQIIDTIVLHFLMIYLSSHLCLVFQSPSFIFSIQYPQCISLPSHACHIACAPPHPPWLDHLNIGWQINMMLFIMQLSPVSSYLLPCQAKIPSSTCSQTLPAFHFY